MLRKRISIAFIILLFIITSVYIAFQDDVYLVNDVIDSNRFVLNDREIYINDIESFDSKFSSKNIKLAKDLNITEEEAFLLGNLSKYWSSNLMKGRKVYKTKKNDLIFDRKSYKAKFEYSGFCLKDSKPVFKSLFEKKLFYLRKTNYKVLDLDTNNIYSYKDPKVRDLKNFLVLRNSQLKQIGIKENQNSSQKVKQIVNKGKVKVIFSDSTVNLYPKRECSDLICKEILNNINNTKSTLDMAIYGYSKVPEIESALINAKARGVKIRLIYDIDSKGKNIYPNTDGLIKLIANNISDRDSVDFKNIMHNKFYIFDNRILITGSANLSNTDSSGFNSNSIIVVESTELAQIYKKEFEQMYSGKFHTEKKSFPKSEIILGSTKIEPYFSPQDKALTNAVLPLIRNAKEYIYIPTFVLTEKRVTEALIDAKKRGVDVKIIIDALNASIRHSKHNELRLGGIEVKTENYAGKMHSKSMLVDDKFTIIGSMNFSKSGENHNDENLVVIEDSEITKAYRDFFLYQWSKIDDKWLRANVRAESKDSMGSCFDGLDNNYDGLMDADDPACKG